MNEMCKGSEAVSILRAYLMPHPPLAVPSVGRGGERKIHATLEAYDEAAAQIARLKPETIVFITPHNVIYSDYFHISPGTRASGDMSRFGAATEIFQMEYDAELVARIADLAERHGLRAGTLGERDASLDHGTTVPMWFINKRYRNYKSVRVSQSGFDPLTHYKLGAVIAQAVNETSRCAVVIASGDLSHKMNDTSSYGFAPEGPQFDRLLTEALTNADFGAVFDIPDGLRGKAAECGYNSVTCMAGCFDGLDVKGRLLSYEGPYGVGYAVMEFVPGEKDNSRLFAIRQKEKLLAEAREKRGSEDAYRSLARQSLEYYILNRKPLPLPVGLPEEMTATRAGAFVSLHMHGQLRGCIGTIAATKENVAQEIIRNAISAGVQDNRFEPVTEDELPFLTYKVDILSPAERISGIDELDVKRYGVIVSSGTRRGLLLPNLDGVDSVTRQVAIAMQKGGIREGEDVTLERFEVTRHE
jgi:AmmeMemoRadiSam system protein A/AmmeMemoRadiSam system protein B